VGSNPLSERPANERRWESNERIAASARSHHFDEVTAIPFICECTADDCFDLLRLTLNEFRAARRIGRYIVAPGHQIDGAGHLQTESTYWIVEDSA
jgi:hypothetical protein